MRPLGTTALPLRSRSSIRPGSVIPKREICLPAVSYSAATGGGPHHYASIGLNRRPPFVSRRFLPAGPPPPINNCNRALRSRSKATGGSEAANDGTTGAFHEKAVVDNSSGDVSPPPTTTTTASMRSSQGGPSWALVPYLVTAPKRGVIGNSGYADRLRKGIVGASRDEKRCGRREA